MDIALVLDRLVPGADYQGSVTANTEEAFNAMRWNDPRPKPTWTEMLIEWLRAYRGIKQDAFREECEAHIYEAYPVPIQSSMALGVYPDAAVTKMKNFIAACIEEENRVFDLIEAAATEAAINLIIPIWPGV